MGVPSHKTVPAFMDAGAWNCGNIIKSIWKIPDRYARGQSGVLNENEYRENPKPNQKPAGHYGMGEVAYVNFSAGTKAATWLQAVKAAHQTNTMSRAPIWRWLHFHPLGSVQKASLWSGAAGALGVARADKAVMAAIARATTSQPPLRDRPSGGVRTAGLSPAVAVAAGRRVAEITARRGAAGGQSLAAGPRRMAAVGGLTVAGVGQDRVAPVALGRGSRWLERGVAPGVTDGANGAVQATVAARMRLAALPSVAPVGRAAGTRLGQATVRGAVMAPDEVRARTAGHMQVAADVARGRAAELGNNAGMAAVLPMHRGMRQADEARLRRVVDEMLDREGRLPPSGATAFDPLLTPAWAGQKIPG